jgi:hypothetical protein
LSVGQVAQGDSDGVRMMIGHPVPGAAERLSLPARQHRLFMRGGVGAENVSSRSG